MGWPRHEPNAIALPIIGIYALNPDSSDSLISDLWVNGLSYVVLGLTLAFAVAAMVSPILLIIWASQRREARQWLRPIAVRSVAATPIFLVSIFAATEIGSLPARFTLGLTPIVHVEVQSMASHRLFGDDVGDLSGATYAMLFHNKTDELAYIEREEASVEVEVISADGRDVSPVDSATVRIFDEERREARLIAIPPGAIQLVFIEVDWRLDGTLGEPNETYPDDGSHWYDGAMLMLEYDLIEGAELENGLDFEFEGLTVHPSTP